jgi:DNA-binding transcriptional ArsR family regulator
MDGDARIEPEEPAETFGALSNATRIDILRALWDADREATFSELREAVGMRDSGQFNYHLGELTDRFVTKTDDEYRLTIAGMQVVGSILAGAYRRRGTIEPISLDEPCPFCGGPRTFRYEDETVEIDCEDCGLGSHFGVPPGAFAGYERTAFPAVAERYIRSSLQDARDGFCPLCEGRTSPTVAPDLATTDDDADVPAQFEGVPSVRYECRRCEMVLSTELGTGLADHPAVVAFYHDHGVDVREASLAVFAEAGTNDARVRDRDPFRASVTYGVDGETLTLVVDGALDVCDVERPDA